MGIEQRYVDAFADAIRVDIARAEPRPAIEPLSDATKRMFDIAMAALMLLIALPAMLFISLLIWLDSNGPIFFRQTRLGLGGCPFQILKFRTMSVLEDGEHVVQATRNDPRVTRIGQFLRKTSLDELPQLINVLRGEMSLVGPRPHARAHDDYYSQRIANYSLRQLVRPGITGWAQVNGLRGETPTIACMRKRLRCDLWYVQNFSLGLDLRILARTPVELLRQRNAH